MIDDRLNKSYLSAEIAQVSESISHNMMSHYCIDIQDQAPSRPASLSLRFDNSSSNYVDLKSHQISRSFHSAKRSDNIDRDRVIGQLETNRSTPMTPTSFLNPKEITVEQEQFAEQLTMNIDKIKSEREGSLAEEIRFHRHPSSNTSPGYVPTDRSTSPPTPTSQATQPLRVKLGDETASVATSVSATRSGPMFLSDVTSLHTSFGVAPAASICTNSAAVAAALHNSRAHDGGATTGSPPSTTGGSTSPASPILENPTGANRYPIVTAVSAAITNRYPSLSLPPLRTDLADRSNSGGNAYASVGLRDMLVGSAEGSITPTSVGGASALADLTAAVTGQVIVNHTTDGFLHLFQHSTDQRHLTSLVSYDGHNLGTPRHLQEYIPSSMSVSYPTQEHQEAMLISQKRAISNTASMTPPPPTMKRSRRRHEPTIAAAQALINATSNGMGQLSYAPTDVANIVGLKMEDRSLTHQSIQPAVSTTSNAVNGHRAGVPSERGHLTSQSMPVAYDSQPISRADTSLGSMDEDMCSDPSMLKIEKKRARNRLAARRCRERKVNRIVSLESEVSMLNSYVEQLRLQLETAHKEANQLRLYLEQLSESYPGLQDKLKTLNQPASQVVQSSPGLRAPPLPES